VQQVLVLLRVEDLSPSWRLTSGPGPMLVVDSVKPDLDSIREFGQSPLDLVMDFFHEGRLFGRAEMVHVMFCHHLCSAVLEA
jgi:hypothetical protein